MAKQQAGRPAVGLTGSTLAALVLAAGSVQAHEGHDTQAVQGHKVSEQKVTVQKAAQPAVRSAGATIARDANTGVLRTPTDEEAAALAAPAAAAAAAPIIEMRTANGFAARVPEEMHAHTVVTKNADGSIDTQCLPSQHAADKAVQSAVLRKPAPRVVFAPQSLRPAEGAPNE